MINLIKWSMPMKEKIGELRLDAIMLASIMRVKMENQHRILK